MQTYNTHIRTHTYNTRKHGTHTGGLGSPERHEYQQAGQIVWPGLPAVVLVCVHDRVATPPVSEVGVCVCVRVRACVCMCVCVCV
jgi:hypothetical protein